MTVGRASLLTVAFAGAVGLGVAISPLVRHEVSGPFMDGQLAPSVEEAAPAQPKASATHARPTKTEQVAAKAESPKPAAETATVSASEPKIHARLKPVLNRGTKVEMAAEGFSSAEQFATVAHAARNTSVPFMVLKHRVLEEGRSLADAIHELKPDVDAKAEVARARQEARSDVDAVSD